MKKLLYLSQTVRNLFFIWIMETSALYFYNWK